MMNVDKALASEMGKTENLKHQQEEKEEALKTAFEEKGKAQELVNQKLKELKDLKKWALECSFISEFTARSVWASG